ncbi:hypothetical protein O3P69_020627 [Scylla paramamosain]|uniref:Uncharacterized protein n=1 Tax=Scylla paramamosain TaxID=85552 RepID=A0AAW0TQ43_SCYPA
MWQIPFCSLFVHCVEKEAASKLAASRLAGVVGLAVLYLAAEDDELLHARGLGWAGEAAAHTPPRIGVSRYLDGREGTPAGLLGGSPIVSTCNIYTAILRSHHTPITRVFPSSLPITTTNTLQRFIAHRQTTASTTRANNTPGHNIKSVASVVRSCRMPQFES